MSEEKSSSTFGDFYPFYLKEHANRVSRRLHFTGTNIAAVLLITVVATQHWWLAVVALIQGYAFAWVGHFFFEHNKPETFKHPLFSFMGDCGYGGTCSAAESVGSFQAQAVDRSGRTIAEGYPCISSTRVILRC